MGIFRVDMGIGNMEGGDTPDVSAMVDTGATHTLVPATTLVARDVRTMFNSPISLADGTETLWQAGIAHVVCQGRRALCPVFFGPEDANV